MFRKSVFAVLLTASSVNAGSTQEPDDLDPQTRALSDYYTVLFSSKVCTHEIRTEGIRAIKSFTAERAGIEETEIEEKIAEYRIDDRIESLHRADPAAFCDFAFESFIDIRLHIDEVR